MPTLSSLRKRPTPIHRAEILRGYRRSKLTQREYADQVGIGLSTLRRWLAKGIGGRDSAATAFIQVPNLLAQPVATPPYRLHLAGGVILEMGSGFESEKVAALLQLLSRP